MIALLVCILVGSVTADTLPLNFAITTLRADSTLVDLRMPPSHNQSQWGNPEYITAYPDEGLVVSKGIPNAGGNNNLTLLRQNVLAIETSASNKQSRVGDLLILHQRALCQLPLLGMGATQFNVTGNDQGVLRVDCVGGDTLVLRGQGAKCMSTWLPWVNNTIRVEGKGQQEIIFSPTSDHHIPPVVSYSPDFISTATDRRLVLEMPRLASSINYTMIVVGRRPLSTTGQPVIVRGCNVQQTVDCQVHDGLGNAACKFEEICLETTADAMAWFEERRNQGECPSSV